CSYGFRPGRSAHQALEALWHQTMEMGGGWIVEVDIRKFFDTIEHGHLRELLKRRVHDGVLLRLIGKWLNAGVLKEGKRTFPEAGTAEGRGGTAPNIVANPPLTPDAVTPRPRLGRAYGHGWQPRLDPRPGQANSRGLGEEESP